MTREPNTQYVLSLSYGKDSLACLGAIEKLGWPLDRIVHAEIWATDTISADLPPMVEFKAIADKTIKERWGIEVEHICAMRGGEQDTYEKRFYALLERGKFVGTIKGFPLVRGGWCKHLKYGNEVDLRKHILSQDEIPQGGGGADLRVPDVQGSMVQLRPQTSSNAKITGFANRFRQYCTGELKKDLMGSLCQSGEGIGVRHSRPGFSESPVPQGANKNTVVQYLGIAADEPKRLERLDGITKISPLAAIGWTELDCKQWCEENDLLSPIYTTATRGGCWFCHNQAIGQLRLLRKNYPDLWALLLKWDLDSPVSFHPDGRTVHDFDRRFALEDEGKVPTDRKFRWKMLDENK